MSTDGGITPVSFIRLAAQSLHRLHRHRDDYLEIKWTLHQNLFSTHFHVLT